MIENMILGHLGNLYFYTVHEFDHALREGVLVITVLDKQEN